MKVAILGVGLIGGSIGMAMRERGWAESVTGWDPDEYVRHSPAAKTALDSMADSAELALHDADLVFLAPPIEAILPLLDSATEAIPETAVVSDVGSAKTRIVAEAERILGGRFVGGHPMAGHEEFGLDHARASLFQGAAWVLTPTAQTDPESVHVLESAIAAMGARPRICDPETHDRAIAYVSHLPHVLAFGLADAAGTAVRDESTDLIAGSFRDGARVSLSDPYRWTEIILENRLHTSKALDDFIAWAEKARSALTNNDREALSELLAAAHRARTRFPR